MSSGYVPAVIMCTAMYLVSVSTLFGLGPFTVSVGYLMYLAFSWIGLNIFLEGAIRK